MEKYAEQTRQEFEGWEEFISKPVDEKLEALALASENVQKHLEGKAPRKVIVVKGKLVNIVS